MGGQRFTYLGYNGKTLSKIDQILVCRVFGKWPDAKVTAMPRDGCSSHTPLLQTGFVDFVRGLFNSFVFQGPVDRRLAAKLNG